jgi:hypothetical protein
MGRVRGALAPEQDAGASWATGAVGEQKLGAALDRMTSAGALLLHDRRLPGTQANIDHLAVTANGVWVIDAKRYSGRIAKVDKGGWFSSDVRLMVGGRDRTKLIAGVHKQIARVATALGREFGAELPVHGVLCFVDADWGWFAKPFVLQEVLVTWGQALRERFTEPGPLGDELRTSVHRVLASSFPPHA